MKKSNAVALLPIFVFLVLYLGFGIVFEYVMKIPMGFYNIPIIAAFLVAILVACIQNRSVSFDKKLEIMAGGLADKNHSYYISYGWCVRWCGRKKQRRERGLLYA